MKKNSTKGFTLAELLIVVAIIAVLVLIAIPVFTASLNRSKAATAEANARSLYAALQAEYLSAGKVDVNTQITGTVVSKKGGTLTFETSDHTKNDYDFSDIVISVKATGGDSATSPIKVELVVDGTYLTNSQGTATSTVTFGSGT